MSSPTLKIPFSSPLQRAFWLIFILLCGYAAYWPALHNQFLSWDDQSYLLANTMLTTLSPESLWQMASGFYASNWHPLTWLSHAVDVQSFGFKPSAHHAVNIVLHIANSGWLFAITWVLLRELPTYRRSAALAAALLFAVHPQHVEVVVWAAERKELLCSFFLLPALLTYVWFAQTQGRTRFYWYALSLLCFALALTAKPMAVTLPLLLLVLDAYPLRRMPTLASLIRLSLEKAPYFALSLAVGILTLLAQQHGGAVASTSEVAVIERFGNAINSLLFYFSKWLLPLNLSPFYPYQYYPLSFTLLQLAIVLALLVTGVYFWRKQQRWWLACGLFYLISLLPVIGLVQVGSQAAADRYAYWPSLPFYLLAGVGIAWLMQRDRRGAILLMALLTSGLILLSNLQSRVWHDDIRLWQHVIDYAPDSHLAHSSLAGQYMLTERYAEAIPHYRVSLAYSHKAADYYYLAWAYLKTGQFDAALDIYQAILAADFTFVDGDWVTIYTNMARLYLVRADVGHAQIYLTQALRLAPQDATALVLQAQINHPPPVTD